MLITAWSSDVCSSDLFGLARAAAAEFGADHVAEQAQVPQAAAVVGKVPVHARLAAAEARIVLGPRAQRPVVLGDAGVGQVDEVGIAHVVQRRAQGQRRSEEHTSELQSLMRISYAVFCLKKKIK